MSRASLGRRIKTASDRIAKAERHAGLGRCRLALDYLVLGSRALALADCDAAGAAAPAKQRRRLAVLRRRMRKATEEVFEYCVR